MYSYGPPHMSVQKQDDQHEHTFSSYMRIQDVVLKTCLGRWTIGRSGERGSGISVLPARHDDDDDDDDITWVIKELTLFHCVSLPYHDTTCWYAKKQNKETKQSIQKNSFSVFMWLNSNWLLFSSFSLLLIIFLNICFFWIN